MNSDERRQSDWLDHELDRMAIDGDRSAGSEPAYASESERAFSETARRLHRLDAAQQAAPDPDFLRNLEQQLMPSNNVSQPWSGPPLRSSRRSALPPGAPLRGEPLGDRGSSRVSFFATLALVVAIVATTLVVTTWDRNGGTPDPTSGGFAAIGDNDATPTPAPAGSDGDGTSGLIPGQPATPTPTPASANKGSSTEVSWSIPFAEGTREASTGLMLIENGLVYRQITMETGTEDGNFSGLQAFHAADGDLAWERVMQWSRSGFAVDDSGLYTVTVANEIVALSPDHGAELWNLSFAGSIVSMELRDGILYVWDSTNRMTAVDAATGETIWTSASGAEGAFQLGGNGSPIASSGVVIGEQALAAIAADGTLVAFDRESGELAWNVPGFDAVNSFTAVTDEMVLIVTAPAQGPESGYEPYPDRNGVGIDLSNGAIRWSITLSGEITIPVAPGGTGMFHVTADQVMTNESPVEASTPEIDAEANGSNELWPEGTPNNIYGEQGPDGNDFVFGIDARTGQITWQRSTSGSGFGGVYISNSSSESLWALTYDNEVIRLGGETGIILDPPMSIPDPIKRIVVGSLEEGAVAETLGGTIYGFGHVPPEEQG